MSESPAGEGELDSSLLGKQSVSAKPLKLVDASASHELSVPMGRLSFEPAAVQKEEPKQPSVSSK